MYKDGVVIGEWPDPPGVEGQSTEYIWVSTGDQIMFKADTVLEATAFLQGILCAVIGWM